EIHRVYAVCKGQIILSPCHVENREGRKQFALESVTRLLVGRAEAVRTVAADELFRVLVVTEQPAPVERIPPYLVPRFRFVTEFHQKPARAPIASGSGTASTPSPPARALDLLERVIVQPLALEFLWDLPFQVGDAPDPAVSSLDNQHASLAVENVRVLRD